MTSKPKDKPKGFTREEAKLTLDTILKRYGIHPSDQSGGEQRKTVPKMPPTELLSEPLTSRAGAQKPFAAVRPARLGPQVAFELRPYLLDTPAATGIPSSDEPKHGFAMDSRSMSSRVTNGRLLAPPWY